MSILSPEEARIISEDVLGLDCCRGIGNTNPIIAYKIGQVQRATAKAQEQETLKEAGEWLEKYVFYVDARGYIALKPQATSNYVRFQEAAGRGEMPE